MRLLAEEESVSQTNKIIKAIAMRVGGIVPDKLYLDMRFALIFHRRIDWRHPTTFNEKLQCLKLSYQGEEYSRLVDKYEVKGVISRVLGEKYIIPTLGVWNDPEEIDFSKLPNKFVLKCTHDSGSVVVCKDKETVNIPELNKHFRKCLSRTHALAGRELVYEGVKPRIICEPYIVDESGTELKDYKFFCFNGEPRFFKVDFGRFTEHHANYYDLEMNLLPFGEKEFMPVRGYAIKKPGNLEEMINCARTLAKDLPFVRVDFYDVNNHVLFGEMTFFPASGFGRLEPDEWDLKIGNMIEMS